MSIVVVVGTRPEIIKTGASNQRAGEEKAKLFINTYRSALRL